MTLCFLQGIELHVIPLYVSWLVLQRLSKVQFPQPAELLSVMAATASAHGCCCCKVLQTDRFNDTFNSILHFLPLGIRIVWHWPTVLIIACVTVQVLSSSDSYRCSLVRSVFFPHFPVCLKLSNRNYGFFFFFFLRSIFHIFKTPMLGNLLGSKIVFIFCQSLGGMCSLPQ